MDRSDGNAVRGCLEGTTNTRPVVIMGSSCQTCLLTPLLFQNPLLSKTKIHIYMLLAASRDVESQQKGIVATVFPTSSPSPSFLLTDRRNQLRGIRLSNELEDAMPIRICACHFCITMSPARHLNLPEKILFSMISKASSPIINRIKMHLGKYQIH